VSGENVELVRRWFGALDTRGSEALIALCDPSGVFISSLPAVDGGVYHGHDRMVTCFADPEDAWGTDMRIEPVLDWG
jgi:ketosteroid isomerase-like protein